MPIGRATAISFPQPGFDERRATCDGPVPGRTGIAPPSLADASLRPEEPLCLRDSVLPVLRVVRKELLPRQQEDAAIEALLRIDATVVLEGAIDSKTNVSPLASGAPGRSMASAATDAALRSVGWESRPAVVAVQTRPDGAPAADIEQALLALPRLNGIRLVSLLGEDFDDAALEPLGKLPHLEEVWFWHTKMTSEGLAGLKNAEGIRKLHVRYHEEGRELLVGLRPFVELRSLYVEGPTSLSELEAIAELPKLEMLDLSDATVPESVAVHLADARSLRDLRLKSTESFYFPDGAAEAIASLPNLERLWIGTLRDADLPKFVDAPRLKTLYIVEGVSLDAAKRFSSQRPDCDVFIGIPLGVIGGGSRAFAAGVEREAPITHSKDLDPL